MQILKSSCSVETLLSNIASKVWCPKNDFGSGGFNNVFIVANCHCRSKVTQCCSQSIVLGWIGVFVTGCTVLGSTAGNNFLGCF